MGVTYGIKTDKCVYIIQFFPILNCELFISAVWFAQKHFRRTTHRPKRSLLDNDIPSGIFLLEVFERFRGSLYEFIYMNSYII